MANSAPRLVNPSSMDPALNIDLIVDNTGLARLDNYLSRCKQVGYDLETNLTSTYFNRRVRTMQFGDRQEQYVVDLLAFAGSSDELRRQQGHNGKNLGSLGAVLEVVKPHLERHALTKIGHNLEFEAICGNWNFGIRTQGFFDILMAEKMLFAGLDHYMTTDRWSLEDLIRKYFGLQADKSHQTTFDLETPLTQDQIIYCALDTRFPVGIAASQQSQMEKEGLTRAGQIEFDAICAFAEMHINGLPINRERWITRMNKEKEQLRQVVAAMDSFALPIVGSKTQNPEEVQLLSDLETAWRDSPSRTEEDRLNRKIKRDAYMSVKKLETKRKNLADDCEGEALINYGSQKQLKELLLKLKFKPAQLPDTGDATLEKLCTDRGLTVNKAFASEEPLKGLSIIDLIRLHRSLSKSIDTYGLTWVTDRNYVLSDGTPCPGHVDPDTGRIHSKFIQLGAATGRTSSTSPNVQNITADGEYRECFTAPEGCDIITEDMKGAELRLLAELSGEPVWINAFNNGWDLHSCIAELVFGDKWKAAAEEGCEYYAAKQQCKCKVHKELRDKRVKILNFSLAYGKTAVGLAEDMGISRSEADDILDRYKKANPVVWAYLQKSGENAVATLTARTLSGRYRKWKRPTWESATILAEKDLKKGQKLTSELISRKLKSMFSSINREGKNASIQGSNADVIKRAMYLVWLGAQQYGLKICNMVHDELVCWCPKESSKDAALFIASCFEKAGSEFVKSVGMPTSYKIKDCWSK